MDYVQILALEAQKAHANYHQYLLAKSRNTSNSWYFFFEGDEDPFFYMNYILAARPDLEYDTFVCNGRDEVIKVHEMVLSDGRSNGQCLYFIDKDHSDLIETTNGKLSNVMFQTKHYSFENYLVCEHVFRRYWLEKLHLDCNDSRYQTYLTLFREVRQSFVRKMRLLMSLVLIGRGIDGYPRVNLNLNNINLDSIIDMKLSSSSCTFKKGASTHMYSVLCDPRHWVPRSRKEVRNIYAVHLRPKCEKSYIRGKYELWFFWKFLTLITKTLTDKQIAKSSGLKRATPKVALSQVGCAELLSPLVVCPVDLREFLDLHLSYNRIRVTH